MSPSTTEVEKKLCALAPKTKQTAYADLQSYIGTQYEMLGMTMPQQRAIMKEGYSFSKLPPAEQLKIWDTVWKETQLFEALSQAALFAEKYIMKLEPAIAWKVLKTWVKRVDNWAHSDVLSGCYAKLLAQDRSLFAQVEKWNHSSHAWERRQSVVIMACYYRRYRDIPFNAAEKLVLGVIGDKDYFVQKGTGWLLREAGRQFPHEQLRFLQEYCTRLAAPAFATSVEKISSGDKALLIAHRKDERKKR